MNLRFAILAACVSTLALVQADVARAIQAPPATPVLYDAEVMDSDPAAIPPRSYAQSKPYAKKKGLNTEPVPRRVETKKGTKSKKSKRKTTRPKKVDSFFRQTPRRRD